MTENTDSMLSVSGMISGERLDDFTLATVRERMNNAGETNADGTKIVDFNIINEEIDGNVALCTVAIQFSDGSCGEEECTLVRGSDGFWRFPFYQ